MSYDVELIDPITKNVLHLASPHFMRGGTYSLGGESTARLNITYNYSEHFYRVLGEKGIRTLYGRTGAESIPILRDAIDKLGDDVSDNYWDGTEGNAKSALLQCLALAQMRPDGVWTGD